MRKSIVLMLIAALLVGAMLVSCNSDAAGNSSAGEKLAKVVISGNNESKGISGTVGNASNVEDLFWFYKANKTDDGVYRTGDTGEQWKPVKTTTASETPNPAAGLTGADLGFFSEGDWKFYFRGYTSSTVSPADNDNAVYFTDAISQTVSDSTKAEDDKVYVTVTLQGGLGLLDCLVSFNGINWKFTSDQGSEKYQPTLDNLKTKTATLTVSYKLPSDESWTAFATSSAAINANGEASFSTFSAVTQADQIRIPSTVSGTTYNFQFTVSVTDNNSPVTIGSETLDSVTAYKGGSITFVRTDSIAINDNDVEWNVVVNDQVVYPSNN